MENYRAFYKVPAKSGKLRGEKRDQSIREQKKKREDTFLERRNIQRDQDSPASAAPSSAKSTKKLDTRREKLMRWKAEKEKIIAQQKQVEKKKPPFKVGVAHHAIDPYIEIKATTLKHTTAKKAAAASRQETDRKRAAKPPTDAAIALAALVAPSAGPVVSSAFSGRVTRSRAAALTVSKPSVNAKAKQTQPHTVVVKKVRNITSTQSVSSARGNVKETKTQKAVAVSKAKASKANFESSFAPKNHKFKAPSSLTLPTTPLTLKRKAGGFKEAHWPVIPGISILSKQPGEPSPKIAKTVVSQRRGRLSRAVKEQKPKKSSNSQNSFEVKIQTPKGHRRTGSGRFVVTDLPEPTVPQEDLPKPKVSQQALLEPFAAHEEEAVTTSKSMEGMCEDSSEVMSSSRAGHPRSSMSAKKRQSLRKKDSISFKNRKNVETEEALPLSMPESAAMADSSETDGNRASQPKLSMSAKKRKSTKGKENFLDNDEEKIEETFTCSLPQECDVETITVNSRRMSIHEPSPDVHVSPENLSKGMVPAQFSPFITSARGKDRYSIQKRRSSLIPIVPEIPPEEHARTKQTEHFRNLLERESSRLLTLSSLWEERRADAPPDAQDKILGPVGLARLLVKDKFQQFRRLVDKFEDANSEEKITVDDLTGFWEMMLLTVENVDKRFKELEDLRESNWEEKEVEVPIKKSTSAPVASKPAKPRTQVQSLLKGIIEAERKRRLEKKKNKSKITPSEVASFDGGFFKVESPQKLPPSPKTKSNSPAQKSMKVAVTTPKQFQRRSLLQLVLTNSAVRAQHSPTASALNKSLPLSPSPKVAFAQMRASQIGKRMSMDSGNESFALDPSSPVLKSEPTKSILKSAVRNSARVNTPRNRVAFEVLNRSENSSPGSPSLPSSETTPPNRTPVSERKATPGNRRRASLIPRLIPTPKQDRPSLMPMRESLISTKPLSNGDLIDFSSPSRGSNIFK